MNTKQILALLFTITAVLVPISCGEEYPFASQEDCNDCISPKPATSSILIDISNPQQRVPIRVYKGKYNSSKDNDWIYADTATYTPFEVEVDVNEYYSVVAEYIKDGKKYTVVDGSELHAYSIQSTCNEYCWIIKGGTMNCMLKL